MTLSTRFHISKFYTKWEVKSLLHDVDNRVDDPNSDEKWFDGIESLISDVIDDERKTLRKKNLQYNPPKDLADSKIWPSIDGNSEFTTFTYPKRSTIPMLTNTSVGGYYKPHFDMVDNGHFSTTIFMNDPSEYDGGELIFWLDGKEVPFKLEPGWGITYETGIGHRVNEVTRGNRLAMVFWTTSQMLPEDLREYIYWGEMMDRYVEPIFDTLGEYTSHPHVIFRQKRYNIMRKYINSIPLGQVIA